MLPSLHFAARRNRCSEVCAPGTEVPDIVNRTPFRKKVIIAMSEEEYRERFPQNKGFFSLYTLGKILKWLVYGIIIFMLLFAAFRSWTMSGTPRVNRYIWTQEAVDAYRSAGGITVYQVPEHNATTINSTFVLSKIYYTEELGQFQFTLRYNRSAFPRLAENLGLSEVPKDSAETFVFTLSDDLGNTYRAYSYLEDSRFVNRYIRLIFTGIDMTDVKTLKLRAYYAGDPESQTPYDVLTLFETRYYKSTAKIEPPQSAYSGLREACAPPVPKPETETESPETNP